MILRVSRHTNNLQNIEHFYVTILGFEKLGDFQNHNNYDGVFIGKPGLDWHFEFNQSETKADHKFDEDDIIVLYPDTIGQYDKLLSTFYDNDIQQINAINPYWNENGKMFMDPEGYRIFISPLRAKIN